MEDKEIYFNQAIEKVQSESIRTWAQTENNRKIFIEMAAKSIEKKRTPEDFATFITIMAMG